MDITVSIPRQKEFEQWCKANKRRTKEYIRNMVKGRIDLMPSQTRLEADLRANLALAQKINEVIHG